MPTAAFISAGSNIEPIDNLRLACSALAKRYGELQRSAVYRTPAVGFDGDDFLNMVVGFATTEAAEQVLEYLEQIHRQARRVRLADPYSPRTLDLDLLLLGDRVNAALKLPHQDIDKYPFVLGPLAEIAPQQVHPVTGKTMAAMWAAADSSESALQRVELDFD